MCLAPNFVIDIHLPFWNGIIILNFKFLCNTAVFSICFLLIDMLRVNVYIINFYSATECNKTFYNTTNKMKWKINFKTKIKMFPYPNKCSHKLPCFYKIFVFNLSAVEICFVRRRPALLLIQSRKEHRGKTQQLVYYCFLLLCVHLHLWTESIKYTYVYKTRHVQFRMTAV